MDMPYKNWLSLGFKILGVVTLVNGLVQAVVQWGSLTSIQGPGSFWMIVSCIAMPLVIIGAGLYLLLGTKGLTDRAWLDNQKELDWTLAIFMVAIKVVGIFLIVEALPEIVKCITEAIYIYNANGVWDTEVQSRFLYQYLLASLLRLVLGYYLLFKGEWLQRAAFARTGNEDAESFH